LQKHESRKQADSSEACRKAKVCLLLYLLSCTTSLRQSAPRGLPEANRFIQFPVVDTKMT